MIGGAETYLDLLALIRFLLPLNLSHQPAQVSILQAIGRQVLLPECFRHGNTVGAPVAIDHNVLILGQSFQVCLQGLCRVHPSPGNDAVGYILCTADVNEQRGIRIHRLKGLLRQFNMVHHTLCSSCTVFCSLSIIAKMNRMRKCGETSAQGEALL